MSNKAKFAKMCYEKGIWDIDKLKLIVITETNKYGYITILEFKLITGEEFDGAK